MLMYTSSVLWTSQTGNVLSALVAISLMARLTQPHCSPARISRQRLEHRIPEYDRPWALSRRHSNMLPLTWFWFVYFSANVELTQTEVQFET